MLVLKNIKKEYKVADTKFLALKGINLDFRENEFVSILGPSGSGKTTLLNIIGGLDHYSEGQLIINGRETSEFKEKDWNVYRNHRIGFIFQSYNLIPHQSVISNVELALTIAGLSKEERTKKAKEALDKVGLSDQYYKKPNQLSGGQSQRVAIARALVNDPEILLADEPTGALDTKTSVQIMDLIKEVAKDRLVIMVTHNPDLAEKYSTRIINLLDGNVLDDSNPLTNKEKESLYNKKPSNKKEQAKMTWWTTFKLSIQNLLNKRNRSILTSIASSIGIIGISLVLSLSFGVQSFITKTQEDMLSGNPITITKSALDLESMMSGMTIGEKVEVFKEIGYVGVEKVVEMIAKRSQQSSSMFIENDITEEYINYVLDMPKEDYAAIYLDREIDITNNLYFDFYENDTEFENISVSALKTIYTSILKENEATSSYANLISNFTNILAEAPNNSSYILEQYDILEGKVAESKNEIMLVLNSDGLISDLTLAQLGYYNQEQFINMILKALDDPKYDPSIVDIEKFSYEELMNKKFVWYPNDIVFKENNLPNKEFNPFYYNAYSKDFETNDQGIELKVVGILEPKEHINYGSLTSGFYYTNELTNHIIENSSESKIVNYINGLEDSDSINSGNVEVSGVKQDFGITFKYSYNYLGEDRLNLTGFVGKTNQMADMIGSIMPGINSYYTLTKRDVGGEPLASKISIYPVNLKHKDKVTEYLDNWNNMDEDRAKIVYSDNLSIVFAMIQNIINVITIALIGFTTLALVVSCVMIAIITYVSVVERVKEIGVIRSLGGSKKDVSNLFVAETVIIGLSAGIIAIGFTYLATFIINLIVVKSLGSNIAGFPAHYAIIMISISVLLTVISGLIPSRSAAKKDPVEALRTE